jgi:ABC-type bacteriocin/lantibiotic exporter with double-glycine peptidase domain
MSEEIPYFKQEAEWTCGAAVMRMVLASFGIHKTEKQLISSLETNKQIGTWEFELPKLAEKYKLTYFVERNGTIANLRRYLKDGFRIIVCYYIIQDREAHFAVLHKINTKYIFLHDPWFGKDHKFELPYFRKVWESDPVHEKDKRWFIAIKNNK